MIEPREPRTAAGRALLVNAMGQDNLDEYADAILAVEAEALRGAAERVRALRDEDRTAVGEPIESDAGPGWGYAQWLREDAALAAILDGAPEAALTTTFVKREHGWSDPNYGEGDR